jgi:ribonucleoside-diphosphate reductase alpha chain
MTDDPDIRIATSVMDYIFRRLALDHLPYDQRAELGILSASERAAQLDGQDPATLGEEVDSIDLSQSVPNPASAADPVTPATSSAPARGGHGNGGTGKGGAAKGGGPHSTAELIEFQQGRTADAPLCLTCGTKMRPAGSCYVCEGCGSTSGCS